MPRVTIRLPSGLRASMGGHAEVDLSADTVGEALHRLGESNRALGRLLLRVDGELREAAAVFVNDRDVPRQELHSRALRDGDVLTVVPPVAGGSGPSPSPLSISPGPLTERFNPDEVRRYSRHLLLPEVGLEGQKKLAKSRVLLIGAGGLGSPAALYLAAAGVGTLGIVEPDTVDLSNLQRQVLYETHDVGQAKVDRAASRIEALNPGVHVARHPVALAASNALEMLREYDVIVDGSDNFPTRYLVNDACVLLGKPDVYGSVYRFEGQATVFDARHGPCYRCLFPEPPPPGFVPTCAEGGVLGVLPGLIGEIQATEALKLLLGVGEPLTGRLLLYDALAMRFRELEVSRDPECVISGSHPTQTGLVDYPAFCGVEEEGDSTDLPSVSAGELAKELAGADPPLLLDVRQPGEWALGHLPSALLIPRSELAERVGELASARDVVVYCSAGTRSAAATRLLRELGIQRVRHLSGGLRSWAETVDPSMPSY